MAPVPQQGRFIYFADLRPDHVEPVRDEAGVERTFVALAIHEEPGVQWEMNDEQQDALLEELAAPSQDENEWIERVFSQDLGEGTPAVCYRVVELDSHGEEIDDWVPGDLEDCKAFLDRYEGAVWEGLPNEPEGAASLVRQRLAELPRLP